MIGSFKKSWNSHLELSKIENINAIKVIKTLYLPGGLQLKELYGISKQRSCKRKNRKVYEKRLYIKKVLMSSSDLVYTIVNIKVWLN